MTGRTRKQWGESVTFRLVLAGLGLWSPARASLGESRASAALDHQALLRRHLGF